MAYSENCPCVRLCLVLVHVHEISMSASSWTTQLSLSENSTVASISFLCWHWRYLIKIFSFVSESARDVIGRKIKISVKKKVKLETKGDKVDNKILVSTVEWLWLHMQRKNQYLRRHWFSSESILWTLSVPEDSHLIYFLTFFLLSW